MYLTRLLQPNKLLADLIFSLLSDVADIASRIVFIRDVTRLYTAIECHQAVTAMYLTGLLQPNKLLAALICVGMLGQAPVQRFSSPGCYSQTYVHRHFSFEFYFL